MKNLIKLLLHLECIAQLEGIHPDCERKFENLLEMDYPLWFVDLESYGPRDKISKMAETLLGLKENVKLRARVIKEGIYAYILIKNSHPNVFQELETSIIVFPTRGICAFSCTGCIQLKISKLDINSRGTIRLRFNDFVKTHFDFLCQKHQNQVGY